MEAHNATTNETRHTTTDDVDVENGDEITVALIHNREEVEFTAEVTTVFNGGWFTAETDEGKILTVNGNNLKVQDDLRADKEDFGMFSYMTVNTGREDDNDTETDAEPVEVELHNDKPNTSAHADGVWVLTDCDQCGEEGYTGESACHDAYEGEQSPGLVCKDCA